ncbi:MAG: LamG-like jellyroll fold domain-containing protein [Planctomycetota bacterium]|jgi:hypothetical protein
MNTTILTIGLSFILSASPESSSPKLVASWDLTKSLDDQKAPSSKLVRSIDSPQQTSAGALFHNYRPQGLLYNTGYNRELCFQKDFTIIARAAFGQPIDWHFANHDTLVSRWGQRGDHSILLRSDHNTKTLHLFLSPDGKEILDYDSGYRIDRSGKFHDLAVTVRMDHKVTFYVDGQQYCTLRYPPPPKSVHNPPDNIPFAIGYNYDPSYNRVHETMNGTIAAVHIYRGVLSDQSIAEMSGIKLEQIKPQPCTNHHHQRQ